MSRSTTHRFDQAAWSRPSWVSAVTPSSRPTSSTILPSITFKTVVPVKRILRPVAGGRPPTKKSLKAGPVWVPPPSHWPTTASPSAIRSAVPQKFRSGNAARKSVMNALMSSRPRRGSCREYFKSISGAAISSTTARFTSLPQNSVNQRPTTALLSSCLLMKWILLVCIGGSSKSLDDARANDYASLGHATLRFLPWNWRDARRANRGLSAHLPAMPQEGIRQHASDHRFTDGHGADADAWVMAAFGDDLRLLGRAGDRAARREDR